MRLPPNEAEAKVNTRPFYQGTDQRWSQGQTTLAGVGQLSLGGGKGWHENEKEQPWKQMETRATCRRKGKRFKSREMQKAGGGSLSSRPDMLFQQLNLVIKIPGIFPSSAITAAHLEQHPSDKTVFQVFSLQRLSFSSPPWLMRLIWGRTKGPPSILKNLVGL